MNQRINAVHIKMSANIEIAMCTSTKSLMIFIIQYIKRHNDADKSIIFALLIRLTPLREL